ncbi:MFS transporter [Caballeronia sp. INSB1]|uniref:MFS transporter n=1 Tax=Caballeronia sp. INSB1 TaxID=2921751 RepID=UPI002032F1B7|nr:MFS transporter [Caballeronia sp. INSB1]
MRQRALSKKDFRTLTLSALGGTLEFYDFVIFVYFTVVIGELFFPPGIPDWLRQLQTFGIFAVGYFVRPLGGIVMAHFGDLLGRKKMFTLSVMMMSIPTLVIGFLPTYAQIGYIAPLLLLVMRVLQGAAVGGEVPGAWVFVSEHVPSRRVGFACGMLTGGLTAGILLGSVVAWATNFVFERAEISAFAWRIPFIVGGVFGVAAMIMRRWLEETPVFKELQARKAVTVEMPLKAVLKVHRRGLILSALLTWVLSGFIIVVVLLMPSLMQRNFHVPAAPALLGNCIATVALTAGCFLAGAASDRFGARSVLGIGSMALAIVFPLFYEEVRVGQSSSSWLPMYALTGFSVGAIGAIPGLMVRAFPAEVRFTGVSFSYNVAYAVFGGLTPILIALASSVTWWAPVIYVCALCLLAVAVCTLLYRRTD